MRDLERKVLSDGMLMQGRQIRLDEPEKLLRGGLADFLARVGRGAWGGRLALELAAVSGGREGRIVREVFLNLRVSMAADQCALLEDSLERTQEGVCALLRERGVAHTPVRFDEDGMLHLLPPAGYTMALKRPLPAREAQSCAARLLPDTARLPLEAIGAALMAGPGSGLSVHLLPTQWLPGETELLLSRPPVGATAEAMLAAPVYAYATVLWGDATDALCAAIQTAAPGTFTFERPLDDDGAMLGDALYDPWRLYQRVGGTMPRRRRLNTLLSACELEHILPVTYVPEPPSRQPEPAPDRDDAAIRALQAQIEALQSTVTQMARQDQAWRQSMTGMIEQAIGAREMSAAQARELAELSPDTPLTGAELRFMGLDSEDDLRREGMTDEQLELLRVAVGFLRPQQLLAAPEGFRQGGNYLPYTLTFGFLYERLARDCYHDTLFVPYYEHCVAGLPERRELGQVELSFYDRGPMPLERYGMPPSWNDWRVSPWGWDNMARAFGRGAAVDGDRLSWQEWRRLFIEMREARRMRNRIHGEAMSGQEAFSFISMMLQNRPADLSLLRKLLRCGRVRASFDGGGEA